jgi:hypothetical protein
VETDLKEFGITNRREKNRNRAKSRQTFCASVNLIGRKADDEQTLNGALYFFVGQIKIKYLLLSITNGREWVQFVFRFIN